MSSEDKVRVALSAIEDIFSDTSVPQEETANNLRSLQDEIDILLDTLDV